LLQGEALRDGWRDEHVKRALELCLSCKACKSECPANVDVATYKAEFLSHYYESNRRPLQAYAFGRIDRWARLASMAPTVANFLSQAPGSRHLLQKVLALAPQRRVPRIAPTSFARWARENRPSIFGKEHSLQTTARGVFLWLDTFNNYFHPETSRAALEVLEQAGFGVRASNQNLCCGRPLYDFGMLETAKGYLRHILNVLGPEINAEMPMVVLEPSCASVFRDELLNLMPDEPRAQKLRKQTFLLSEFLELHAPEYKPALLSEKVLLHGHCHQKALMKMSHEESLLRKMGVELQSIDSGCCGMAGPFGFQREHFEVSQAIGERVLLPAIRNAAPETIIVSDGFSCREQIFQATGRKAHHLAEALRLTRKQEASPSNE